MKKTLSNAVDFYLATRRHFGFALRQAGAELHSLCGYARKIGHRGPLTTSLATRWAQSSEQCAPGYRVHRLNIVRRFAQFWQAYDPRTQIPPCSDANHRYRRRPVHIYSSEELATLSEASAVLGRLHPLRAATFCTVLGLLACTGLRISEALQLSDRDIDWTTGLLTVTRGKNGHKRLLPIHASTLEALMRYQALRKKVIGSGGAPRFFVTFCGEPVGYFGLSGAFRKLCRSLGWIQAPVPRLHDLRHTFAVRTLLHWYQNGEPIGPKLWTLSTYLGHRHLADTYWYLSAVPELMNLFQERFATDQAWASQATDYE